LATVHASSAASRAEGRPPGAGGLGERRQQDERQDHGQVLDDEPADRDPAVGGVEGAAVLEDAQQHHRARDRQRQAEQHAREQGPPPGEAETHAEGDRDRHLRQRARQGDAAHGHQVADGEVQADAEHQQADADLGELAGEAGVGDEARRERADGDAGEEVADQRGQAEAVGEEAEGAGEDQRAHDGGDERGLVRHRRVPSSDGRRGLGASSGYVTWRPAFNLFG
jgi:hypothetical protein